MAQKAQKSIQAQGQSVARILRREFGAQVIASSTKCKLTLSEYPRKREDLWLKPEFGKTVRKLTVEHPDGSFDIYDSNILGSFSLEAEKILFIHNDVNTILVAPEVTMHTGSDGKYVLD